VYHLPNAIELHGLGSCDLAAGLCWIRASFQMVDDIRRLVMLCGSCRYGNASGTAAALNSIWSAWIEGGAAGVATADVSSACLAPPPVLPQAAGPLHTAMQEQQRLPAPAGIVIFHCGWVMQVAAT
jgi:hypothetical protein